MLEKKTSFGIKSQRFSVSKPYGPVMTFKLHLMSRLFTLRINEAGQAQAMMMINGKLCNVYNMHISSKERKIGPPKTECVHVLGFPVVRPLTSPPLLPATITSNNPTIDPAADPFGPTIPPTTTTTTTSVSPPSPQSPNKVETTATPVVKSDGNDDKHTPQKNQKDTETPPSGKNKSEKEKNEKLRKKDSPYDERGPPEVERIDPDMDKLRSTKPTKPSSSPPHSQSNPNPSHSSASKDPGTGSTSVSGTSKPSHSHHSSTSSTTAPSTTRVPSSSNSSINSGSRRGIQTESVEKHG